MEQKATIIFKIIYANIIILILLSVIPTLVLGSEQVQQKAYYQAKEQAAKEKIELVNQRVYGKYDAIVTHKIDALLTPETNGVVKFSVGVAEGIPKGLLDITMLSYNLSQRMLPQNIYATSMTTYYKVKDNPEKYAYLVKHPLQTGGAIAGALYDGGRQYVSVVLRDPRAAGNLVGSFVGIGGAAKTIGATGKGLTTAAKTLENISFRPLPVMAKTPVAVSTGTFTLNTRTALSGSYISTTGKLKRADQKKILTLYHGTTKEGANSILKNGLNIEKTRTDTDFGRGFYVTPDFKSAQKWAFKRGREEGIVLKFKVPLTEFKKLKGMVFETVTPDWSDFVLANRLGKMQQHKYDFVDGPIVTNVKELLENGQAPSGLGRQISFHTNKALSILMKGLEK